MIANLAVRYAGPGAHLVARPAGVPHVYVGPLTRSGKSVPRASRPVCRARTRRLSVLPHTDRRLLQRVCARCVACLTAATPQVVRQAPRTRDDYLAAYAGTTLEQLAAAARAATTVVELDQVGHLSLLLHGHQATREHHVDDGRSLTAYLGHRRRTLTHNPDRIDRQDALTQHARERRRGEWAEIREQRLDRALHAGRAPAIR